MYLEPINLLPVNLLQLFYVGLAVFGLILVSPLRRFNALGLLLCLQAVLMTLNFTEEMGITRSVYLVTPIFTLGFGPAIYFFVRQVVYGETVSLNNLTRHFSPMLVALPFTHWPQLVIACGAISQAIYLVAAVLLVRRYHRTSRQLQSDADSLKLNWLNMILGIFLLMMLQDMVRLNLQPYAPLGLLQPWYFANIAVDFVLSAYLILKAVRQPALFERLQEAEVLGLADQPDAAVPVADPDAQAVFLQIDQLIRTREMFKQQRLSLRDLADATGLHEKNISWAVNQGAQKSFCDYINGLRVQAVCEQLRFNAPATILDIAFAMGFSAKSTFNTVFKKETGQTPSQFANAVAKSNFSGSES